MSERQSKAGNLEHSFNLLSMYPVCCQYKMDSWVLFTWFGNALEPLEWAKTLMSRCFKIFRYFRRYMQNWMQKWTFLQKWRAQNRSSIKILHYRPLQHADRPNLSELWQKCDWRDFWSFLGLFFAAIVIFLNFLMGKPFFCPLFNVARVMPIKNGPLGAFDKV